MNEADKKRIADLNAEADKHSDWLLQRAIASPFTWGILTGYGIICAVLGGIIRTKFGC